MLIALYNDDNYNLVNNIEVINQSKQDIKILIFDKENIINITQDNITVINEFSDIFTWEIKEDETIFYRKTSNTLTPEDIIYMIDFLNSDKEVHFVRYNYDDDEPLYRSGKKGNTDIISNMSRLVHTNIVAFKNEEVIIIDKVYDLDINDDTINYIYFLLKNKQYNLILHLIKNIKLFNLDYDLREQLLYYWYMACYNLKLYSQCREILDNYKHTIVHNNTLFNSNDLIYKLKQENNYNIVGTTNINYEPKSNEIVIYYGNFPIDHRSLPITNIMYRHVTFFTSLVHDKVYYNICWKNIDIIYIINLEERVDRYCDTLLELCHMNAPLDRIHHHKATKTNKIEDEECNVHYNVTKSHYEVVSHFIASGKNNALILEDDFKFSSNYKQNKLDILKFMNNKYDFDVCLWASSKYFEYKPYDDLLNLSYQECTTAAGYMINKSSAPKVLKYFSDGLEKIIETGDFTTYVCDRYWSELQKDNKFFVFKNKLGFQRPSYSATTGNINMNLD